jgi:Skp family chaperone for outer membrane proteins
MLPNSPRQRGKSENAAKRRADERAKAQANLVTLQAAIRQKRQKLQGMSREDRLRILVERQKANLKLVASFQEHGPQRMTELQRTELQAIAEDEFNAFASINDSSCSEPIEIGYADE